VDGGATASYVYDADGRRVRKTTSAGSVDYLYDSEAHEIAEVSSGGSWNRGEVYASGRHLATYAFSSTYFIHADHLGTERARSNVSGTLAESCTSLAFGDWLSCSGTDASPMHFTGKEHDTESGLENFGARYYAGKFGRFVTVDGAADPVPLPFARADNPQSLNLYAYVENNPISSVDPDGHAGDDLPLPGFGKYTVTLHRNNPNDLPNIHVKKSGIEVARVRFNADETTIVTKGSLSTELKEAVEEFGRDKGFFETARVKQLEINATRGTGEEGSGGTAANVFVVLQFAQMVLESYLDKRDAPEMDKKLGYHYWFGMLMVTNTDLAAKNLPEGTVLWVEGLKFTLHNGKWVNEQGWTLLYYMGQIHLCPPFIGCQFT